MSNRRRNELSGRDSAAQFDGGDALDQLGVLDHHHSVGAARHHTAGRDGGRGAGRDFELRRVAAGDHFRVELELFGAASAAPSVSAARSAKPSTLARSNGGTSMGAIRSLREHAADADASETRSPGSGDRSRFFSKRRRASSPTPLQGIAPAARRCARRRAVRSRWLALVVMIMVMATLA